MNEADMNALASVVAESIFKDAERYRWLVANPIARLALTTPVDDGGEQVLPGWDKLMVPPRSLIDAQIDACMSAERGE